MEPEKIVTCWICGKSMLKNNAYKQTLCSHLGVNEYECRKCAKNKELQRGIAIGKARALDMYDNGIYIKE